MARSGENFFIASCALWGPKKSVLEAKRASREFKRKIVRGNFTRNYPRNVIGSGKKSSCSRVERAGELEEVGLGGDETPCHDLDACCVGFLFVVRVGIR